MGQLTLMPAPDQRVLIDGRRVRFSELERGQQLSLYVSEGRFAIATEPGAPVSQEALIMPAEPAPIALAQPAMVAQAEPASLPQAEMEATRLPDTAGPLPWLAATGLLSLLGGVSLTLRRRFSGCRAWFALVSGCRAARPCGSLGVPTSTRGTRLTAAGGSAFASEQTPSGLAARLMTMAGFPSRDHRHCIPQEFDHVQILTPLRLHSASHHDCIDWLRLHAHPRVAWRIRR